VVAQKPNYRKARAAKAARKRLFDTSDPTCCGATHQVVVVEPIRKLVFTCNRPIGHTGQHVQYDRKSAYPLAKWDNLSKQTASNKQRKGK
jgi:hypothetical protein